jgi:Protein of unknown function (DUF1161)
MSVRRLLGVAPLIIAAIPIAASAKNCDDVKAEIDAKIKAKGVTNYVLQIVNGSDVKEAKIVGNCGQGLQKIVYLKNAPPSRIPSPPPPEPLSPAPTAPTGTEASR